MTPKQREAAERLAPVLADIANTRTPSAAGFAVAEAAALLRELAAAPQGEPVAWLYESKSGSSFLHRGFTKVRFEADMRASKEYPDGHTMTPLYTHPPQRQPLSDEQITALVREAAKGSAIRRDGSTSHRIARAIEKAHGITGEPT